MKLKKKPALKSLALISLGLSLLLFLLCFLTSGRLWFRLDLTGSKAYTLSKVSRELYREIESQVKITYYISDKLSQAHPMPAEITDLLREYAAYSRGRIRLVTRDPLKSNQTQLVESLGILPQQIQVVERDESVIATVYTGILIEYLDRQEVLPVVFSLDTLEYDLTSRIRSMIRDEERTLGVIVGDSGKEWASYFALLNQELLFAGYQVRLISAGEEIPDSLPCLLVLGGVEGLDDWALYRIDRYLQGGGRAFFAQDGIFVDPSGGLEGRKFNDGGLLAMLAGYGVVIREALVLDQANLNVTYQTQTQSGALQYRIVRYPEWISVQSQAGNAGHPVCAGFNGLDLYWASPLELSPPQGVEAVPLFFSTAGAWLQTGDFVINPERSALFSREAEATRGEKILGAALSGVFPSAYRDRSKPEREGSGETLPDMPLSPKASRIVVVGDTDFAGGFMQSTRSESRNLDFLLRALDWLSSDDDLIGIRNRGGSDARLDRIQDPERRKAAMAFSRGVNVFLVPLAVALLGLFRLWKRKTALSRSVKTQAPREENP